MVKQTTHFKQLSISQEQNQTLSLNFHRKKLKKPFFSEYIIKHKTKKIQLHIQKALGFYLSGRKNIWKGTQKVWNKNDIHSAGNVVVYKINFVPHLHIDTICFHSSTVILKISLYKLTSSSVNLLTVKSYALNKSQVFCTK